MSDFLGLVISVYVLVNLGIVCIIRLCNVCTVIFMIGLDQVLIHVLVQSIADDVH